MAAGRGGETHGWDETAVLADADVEPGGAVMDDEGFGVIGGNEGFVGHKGETGACGEVAPDGGIAFGEGLFDAGDGLVFPAAQFLGRAVEVPRAVGVEAECDLSSAEGVAEGLDSGVEAVVVAIVADLELEVRQTKEAHLSYGPRRMFGIACG